MMTFVLAGMYVTLSMVFALAVSKFIPSERLPDLHIPKGLEQAAVGGIIVFSIVSLLLTSVKASSTFDFPLIPMFIQMLNGTVQGKGLLGILLCGAIWYGADALAGSRIRAILQLLSSCGFIVSASVSMHATNVSLFAFSAQTIHLFAVSFWIGFLFLAGWFARSNVRWRSFLGWFSPSALLCLILVVISGVVLMNSFSSDWIDTWVLSYGQVLLVKHLLFIPLIAFASINGIWMRKRLAGSTSYDPRSWIKAESVMAVAVFTTTAVLSQQVPPNDTQETLRYTAPSHLFLQFYNGSVTPEIHLSFVAEPLALIFLVSSVVFLGMTFFSFYRVMHVSVGLCTSLLFVISGYLGLMFSLQ
jgi:putative copper resistance protein D